MKHACLVLLVVVSTSSCSSSNHGDAAPQPRRTLTASQVDACGIVDRAVTRAQTIASPSAGHQKRQVATILAIFTEKLQSAEFKVRLSRDGSGFEQPGKELAQELGAASDTASRGLGDSIHHRQAAANAATIKLAGQLKAIEALCSP